MVCCEGFFVTRKGRAILCCFVPCLNLEASWTLHVQICFEKDKDFSFF